MEIIMAKVLPIAQLGAAIIRKISAPVKDIHAEQIQNLIDDLLLTCHNANGMGIAAPQTYHAKRIFIMSSQPNARYPYAPVMEPEVVINPEITWQSDAIEKDWEGCLTLPGLRGLVPRRTKIKVRYTNREKVKVERVYEGFLARIFQHELDHLNGKVFIDRVESTLDIVMEKEFQRMLNEKICHTH